MTFIGQLIVTLIAGAVALMLLAAVASGDVIALEGCAICDNAPPNYLSAVVLTAIGAMLVWIVFRRWRAACFSGVGYR